MLKSKFIVHEVHLFWAISFRGGGIFEIKNDYIYIFAVQNNDKRRFRLTFVCESAFLTF